MAFHLRTRFGALAFALAWTLVAAACNAPAGSGASVGPTAAAGGSGSGSAACPTAPSVPDDLEGWSNTTATGTLTPVQITNVLACGANRVLFSFLDKSGRPIATPDRHATFSYFDLGRQTTMPFQVSQGTFVWAIQDAVGIFVTNVEFPDAGRYGVEIATSVGSNAPEHYRMTFDVRSSTPVVKVGDKAPSTKTPTLADAGGDPTKISTDPSPDPALYQTSVDTALAAHKPFVLVFATPKFCQTAQCGPTLERIKPFVARYPGVAFIHVEPYKLKLVDGTLQADLDANSALQQAQTTQAWRLLNEPSVYVVDRNGIVSANFELIFSDAELTAALDAVK